MVLARTLAEATGALHPDVPLLGNSPQFVDFSEVRGDGTVKRLKKLFERQRPGAWLHTVFASHRGAGKSTELLRLTGELQDRYFCIYFAANVEMDPVEFELSDLLLVLAREVESQMRSRGTPLPAATLMQVEKFFSEVVFTDEYGRTYVADIESQAKLSGGIPFFASLMSNLTASVKRAGEHTETIRRQVQRFPGTLIELVNNLLKEALAILAAESRRLLIVIDNMDRYDSKFIDRLLVASLDVFRSLCCDLVLTPPIDLLLKPESQGLDTVLQCIVMPTIKLREPDQGYWEISGKGHEKLLEVLAKRIDLERLIPDIAVRHRLVSASGGGIRELLSLAQSATLDAAGETITADDLEVTLSRQQHILRNKADYNGWWPALQQIAKTKRLTNVPEQQAVVFQRLAFQYNGKIWHDVHPLISDLPEIQDTLTAGTATAKENRATTGGGTA